MNRRTFLKTTTATTALFAIRPAWGADPAPQKLGDDEFLASVRGGIEKHRQSGGAIVVRGADGQPVPNATVKIEQTRHDFLFGCNFFMFDRVGDPKLEEEYRTRFSALLNYATLPFYWASYEPQRGQPGYAYSEKAAEWCRQHGIAVKGHPLVWDHPAGNPSWLPQDLQEVGRLALERVRNTVERFKGKINIWDVVNEAVHLGEANTKQLISKWATKIGATAYVGESLKTARAANPKATLLVNDYRLDPPYYGILDSLRENGKLLFDAIGLQSHMHNGPWRLRTAWQHCETFGKFGVPLHFTEATVVSGPRTGPGENWGPTKPEAEAKQADYVTKFYTTLFAHPAVQAITWWDFSDRGAWQGAAAGWVRKDMSPKPVYERLLALIKGEWWTKAQGRTDAQGSMAARAFYGTHKVTVELPNGRTVTKEVTWERGKDNRFELTAA
jgi:endo-1,4-beta-xylanase